MTRQEVDFETWYGVLQCTLLDEGIDYNGEVEAVRLDYLVGANVFDVANDIMQEY